MVSSNGGGILAIDANVRLMNYSVMALLSSIKLKTTCGKTTDYIDPCHPNLLMYKLLAITSDEYENDSVRDERERDSQLKCNHAAAAQRGHMYMMIKMKDLFGFIND